MKLPSQLLCGALAATLAACGAVNADDKAAAQPTLRGAAGERLLVGAAVMARHLEEP